jgi:hypothetical protein
MNSPKLGPSPETLSFRVALWRPNPIEIAGWCALAWVVAFALFIRAGSAGFGNDGYQYLSVAENIRDGHGIKTSIVYFDSERAHGTIPAPVTTFPPGYSVLAAVASTTGIRLEVAATGISQLSFALLPFALGLAVPIGIRPWAYRLATLLLILNSSLLALTSQIASDALFTVVVAVAIGCFARVLSSETHSRTAWQVSGWLLLGLSYWIRYAGLFVLCGVLVFFCFRAALRRDRRTIVQVLTSVPALGFVAASMLRNVALNGSWKGSVAKQGLDRWQLKPGPLVASLYHAVFSGSKAHVGIGELLLAAGIAGFLILVLRLRLRPSGWHPQSRSLCVMLCVVVCAYCAGMLYAALTMVILLDERYLVPLLPPIFLLVACALSAIEERVQWEPPRPGWPPHYLGAAYSTCVALVAAGYFMAHVQRVVAYSPRVPHQETLNAFREPAPAGGDLTAWVRVNIGPSEVITATNGQSTAYALHRATLCVVDPPFSTPAWDRATLLSQMKRFKSRYLIIYPGLPVSAAPVQVASPFIRGLLRGDVPADLHVVAHNASVIILRRADTAAM